MTLVKPESAAEWLKRNPCGELNVDYRWLRAD